LAGACDAPESAASLRPEGPPEVLEVYVTGPGGLELVFCKDDGSGKDAGPGCVLAGAEAAPVVAAVLVNQKIRFVVDELLDGTTAEAFGCACAKSTWDPLAKAFTGMCPGDKTTAAREGDCPDDPKTTAKEQGHFADNDNNGAPDNAQLLPGLAKIACGDQAWENAADGDGFYNPTGSQLVLVTGIDGLGPALVVTPPTLKADQDCMATLVGDKLKDKDGVAVAAHTVSFHTQPVQVVASVPAANAVDVDSTMVKKVIVTFNTTIDATSVDTFVVGKVGGATFVEVPGKSSLDPANATEVQFVPEAGAFEAGTTYVVHVLRAARDTFGIRLAQASMFSFTTKGP
jgi:hypothetical protein